MEMAAAGVDCMYSLAYCIRVNPRPLFLLLFYRNILHKILQ